MFGLQDSQQTAKLAFNMAAFSNAGEGGYDEFSTRSPRGYRPQHMNRQIGRQDGFSTMHGGFGLDHGVSSSRFGGRPDPFGNNFQQPPSSTMSHFPFDVTAAQTWNSPAPGMPSLGNGMGPIHQNGDYGQPRGVKPSRGRVGVNQASLTSHYSESALTFSRSGTSSPRARHNSRPLPSMPHACKAAWMMTMTN